MSKRLATALKLSPDWRGSWLSSPTDDDNARFHLAERLNFRRALLGTFHKDSNIKTFTASGCGRYLLVLSGPDVFIYRLDGGKETMTPIVRLAADRNVVKVSMDTSSGRYAVAALLDNRTGLSWDIADEAGGLKDVQSSSRAIALGISTGAYTLGPLEETHALTQPLPQRRRGVVVTEHDSHVASESPSVSASEHPSRTDSRSASPVHGRLLDDGVPFTESPQSELDDANVDDRLAIQTRPTAVYRNLGTAEDPPRSVAICPQRKCIAFGCRLGIELHWVDALTGGDLSRWFPLAAPSDHLYFLPERAGFDSTRKLRLISSAQGPSTPALTRSGSMPARLLVRRSTHDRGRRQSMTRLFFGNLPFPAAAATAILPASWTNRNTEEEDRQGVLRTVDCDHYQAIPLSDGSHVLYTDPASGQLCLGSDAPIGAPTKLVRKVIFISPDAAGDDGWGSLMSCYTAGHELRWGVRVVAAHRDGRIILYNVPSDLFGYLRDIRSSVDIWDETSGVLAQSDLLMDNILTAHPNTIADADMGNDAARGDAESPFRTIQVQGVQVGHVGHEIVDEIVVSTAHGGVGIWIFCRSGLARRLDIYTPPHHTVRSRFVSTDGLLYNEPQPVTVDASESSKHNGKGKQRSDSYAASVPSSTQGVPVPDCDGAYDIDVDGVGGLWIAETDDGAHLHDAFPDRPACDEEMAAEVAALRLQIEVTGSASKEGPLYAQILAEDCD